MKAQKLKAAIIISVIMLCLAGLVMFAWFLQKPNSTKIIAAWWMDAEYIGSDGVLLQTKRNNCGPTTLKMIFDYYKIPATLKEIEKGAKLTKKGSSMLALREMANIKGLKAEGWRFTLEDFMHSKFPSILYVNKDHYVVADSISFDGNVYLCDPAIGRLKIAKEKLCKIWEGETLVFGNVK